MRHFSKYISRILFCFLAAGMLLAAVPARTVYAEAPYTNCSPKKIHPIYWKATIRGTFDAKIMETGKTTKLRHSQQVIVTSYAYKGNNTIMLKSGKHCRVHSSRLNIYDDACTPGDFTKRTKNAFVNSRTLKSKTKWLIWVSTDRQSLNVFRGSNRKWSLYKSFKCSTGMANWSTPLGRRTIKRKFRSVYSEEFDSHLAYFLEFGGSGIHVWPGPHEGQFIGKKPCSHACVRLGRKAAIWCYQHIPVKTLMYVY